MGKLADEAVAHREELARTARRRHLFGQIRTACGFLLAAALIGCGIYYHRDLQHFISNRLTVPKAKADGGAGDNLQAQASHAGQAPDAVAR